ncbi:MAG: fused MFS/spermidine synthase [bacterium]
MNPGIGKQGVLVILLFFLSGFSGLVYEIVWVRMLTMYVGGGNFSVSMVLTVFMAGLALGSALAGRLVDRIRTPQSLLTAYGLLELAIGIYGLLFPLILALFAPAYARIYRATSSSLLGYGFASSGLSMLLLILPATLMGATLPLLCRYLVKTLPAVGTRSGLLYGLNTIGGALGALVAGFWLVRWLGVTATLWTAVTINAVIGVTCLVAFGGAGASASLVASMRQANPSPMARPGRQFTAVCAMLAVSGFCAMACEVIWTRLLALLIGPTMYSFTIILFTFITGLALGSLLFGWLCDRSDRPLGLLIATQLAAAISLLLVTQLLGNSQLFFAKLLQTFHSDMRLLELSKVAVLFLFMVIPTIFLGAAFPIAVRIGVTATDTVGSSVGKMYAANTVGALLGSFLAGFVLIPVLGKAQSISLLVALQATASGVAYLLAADRPLRRMLVVPAGVVAVVVAACLLPRWDNTNLTKARYHRFSTIGDTLAGTSLLRALFAGTGTSTATTPCDRLLYLGDGIGGFVAVGETRDGMEGTNLFLSINGKIDASSMGDMSTCVLLGQMPMLMHKNASNAMVIGLASGITAGEMLHYPLQRLDVLEISPEVVKACGFFSAWNNNVLRDQRVQVINQDARTHLTLTDRKYDIIVSEPSNPWMAGVANLFSADFYEKVHGRLNPGGIFVQWIHAYQSDWEMFSMQGRTFTSVFRGGIVMNTSMGGDDYLLIATRDGESPLNQVAMEQNLQYARQSSNMSIADHRLVFPLLRSENTAGLFGSGPLHTDDLPMLEYLAPTRMYTDGGFEQMILEREDISPSTQATVQIFTNSEQQVEFAEFMASMNAPPFGLLEKKRANDEQLRRYRRAVERYSRLNLMPDYTIISDPDDRRICATVQSDLLAKHLAGQSTNMSAARLHDTYIFLGNTYVILQDYQKAATAFQNALAHLPRQAETLRSLAACLEATGSHSRAIEILDRLCEIQPGNARTLSRLGANHLKLGNTEQALSYFKKALALDPAFGPALQAVGAIHGDKGDYATAIEYSKRAIEAVPDNIRPYQNVVIALANSGRIREAMEYAQLGLSIDPTNEVLLAAARILAADEASRQQMPAK